MSDQPAGKDGVARVIARIKMEYKIWRRAVKPHTTRWKKNVLDSHAFVNIWVEGNRVKAAAYFTGHLLTFLIISNVITVGLLIWKW